MKGWAAPFLICVLSIATCNVITMGLSQTSKVINATANYTFSMERTLDANGATITPSQLATGSVITIYLSGFNLSAASCPSNQTCVVSGTTVSISGVFSPNANLTSLQLVINNIINPLLSNTQISISSAISTAGTVVDQASTSTSFTPSSFISAVATFAPGNVTYNSNLTLSLTPSITMGDSSHVNVTIPRYWKNSKKNASSNVPAGVTCSIGCNLTSMVSSFVVTFNNVTCLSGGSVSLVIGGVVSPPTTESADSLSLATYDSSGYQLDLGTSQVAATLPNYFALSSLAAGALNKAYNLTFSFQTSNIFATNDTVTIVLPPETSLTSTSTASIANSAVASAANQLIMPNTIQIINNTLSFANPAAMTVTLTSLSGIVSTKPTSNLVVTVYRNGFAYNYGSSPIVATSDVLSFTIDTTSVMAAANATYTLTVALSNALPVNGFITVTFPDLIILRNCSSAASSNTTCSINNAKVNFTIRTALGQSAIVLIVGVRNPVSSTGMSLLISTYDSQGYLMDSGNTSMFAVQQASLPSSVITCSLSSSVVYDTANYTFSIDLSSYQLSAGYGVITLPTSVEFINLANSQCAVNGQPQCILNSTTVKFPVSDAAQLYTVAVGQLKNPQSTLPFTFAFVVTDVNGSVYYNTTSAYYSANVPLVVSATQTNTNCTNQASSGYTVSFTVPSGIATAGSIFKAFVNGVQQQTLSNSFSNPLSLQLVNQPSLMPWSLFVKVTTSDGYDMFNSTISVVNCQPAALTVTGQISGLPEDNTVISVSVSSSNGADTLIVGLPLEYSTSGLVCVPISNLSCTVLTNQTIKLVPLTTSSALNFQLTNITNPLSSGLFSFQTYISGYLSSSNNNSLRYQAPCLSPCRSCLSSNTSACAGCFKVIPTVYPIYDPAHNLCVTSCPNGFFNLASVCASCPVECSTCIASSNCSVCASSFNLFQGKCLTDCPDLYYPSSGVCYSCNAPCLTCVSASSCKSCSVGYSLLGSQCLQQCPNTTISTNQQCLSCTSPCQTCHFSLTNCSSCYSGSFLYNQTCVANCPSGYVAVGDSCLPCFGCLTCITNQSTCTTCSSSTLLYNFTCRSDCPTGYYALANDSSCIRCPNQCGSCTTSSNCSTCVSPYNLHGTSCLSNCPAATMPYQLQCVNCIVGCSQCSLLSTCDNCSSGYFLYHSICITSCPTTTYLANNTQTCLDCPSQCATCNPLCLSCVAGYLLYNGTCLLTCPITTTQKNNSCQDCTSLYSYCSSCTSLACLSCSTSFLFYNGSCLANCPASTININGTCTACKTGCTVCSVSTSNCSACTVGYLFYAQASSCVLSCPYPSIPNAAATACISCNPECSSCVSLTNCSTCASGYSYYNYSCLSTCPLFMYSLNGMCQNCSSGCLSCNSTSCQSCQPQLYVANGACYSQCPAEMPFAFNTKCNKCSQNCTSCTASACVACETPLLISGVSCVSACPENTTIQDNIRCVSPKNDTNNNTTTNSTNTTLPTSGGFQFVPFTVFMAAELVIVGISKLQYSSTYMFGGMSSLTGLICFVSWIVVAALNITAASIGVSLFLALAAILIQIVLNIVFLVKNSLMLRTDDAYQSWKGARLCNKVSSTVLNCLSVLSFKAYLLQFSQLFRAHCFRSKLDSLGKFSFYDTILVVDMLSNILAIAAGGAGAYYNSDAKNVLFFICVDCIIVSLVDLLLGLATKKRKGIFDEQVGSESDIERMGQDSKSNKEAKQSMTMQKLLSEFQQQPSMSQLQDGNQTPNGGIQEEHHQGGPAKTRPNRVGNQDIDSDEPMVNDPNAKPLTSRNIFEQESDKISQSQQFQVEEGDATQSAPPEGQPQFAKGARGKESSAQDTQQQKNQNASVEKLSQVSQYSERQPIRLGIEKYIDMTLQGKRSEQENMTTVNDHHLQHLSQGTANNADHEDESERNQNPRDVRDHEEGYLTEGGQKPLDSQRNLNGHPNEMISSTPLLEKEQTNDQGGEQGELQKQGLGNSQRSFEAGALGNSSAKQNKSASKLQRNSKSKLSLGATGKPIINKIREQTEQLDESVYASSKAEETHQLRVPQHIEASISQVNIQGPLVYQDTVLNGLVSPSRSEKQLQRSSGNLKRSSSIRNSRAAEQINLKTIERSQLEEVNSRSEENTSQEEVDGKGIRPTRYNKASKEAKKSRGKSKQSLNRRSSGRQPDDLREMTPPAHKEERQSVEQQGEHTDEVGELRKGSTPSRGLLSSSKLKSPSIKRSAASSDPPRQQANCIPQKSYLKESPRLAPFKFRRSRKDARSHGNQTLKVERQLSDSGSSREQEQQFEPVVIDMYHKHIKGQSKQQTVPVRLLPTTKSRQLPTSQSLRSPPARRLQSSNPRNRQQPSTLTSRDNVQLMLQRIQTSHRKQQKMKELQSVYLSSIRKN